MAITTATKLIKPTFENIPQEMKNINQWVVWRGFPKDDGKLTKKPYSLDGKHQASFHKHHTFAEALASCQNEHVDGIGFAMSKEAGYICIDLDADSLEGIPDSLKSVANHSYAELSPSGNGMHIWFKGEWPGEKSKQGKAIRYTKDKYKVEFYYETGYLTMTGNTLNDLDIEENQDMIDYLYNMTQHGKKDTEKPSSTKVKTQPKTSLEDEAVLKEVLKDKLNERMFKAGDISNYNNDHSNADHGLCMAIARVSTDAEQIERLFRQSALFREAPIKAKTYPARTIASAMLKVAAEKEKDLALLLEDDAADQKVIAYERTFFGGDKGTTFIPKWLGDNIMKEYPVFYNGTHTYIYRNGVYHRDDGGIIGRIVVEKLGDMFKRDRLRETVSYLQNKRWIKHDRVNTSNELINVKNGLLEWKTGVLHPHTPEHLSTIQLPLVYDPEAKAPNIKSFFKGVVSSDTIPTLCEWFGYSMIPSTRYEKAVFLTGSAGNGKSKFIDLYGLFIGEGNTSNVTLQDLEHNRFKLAQIQGKLANVYADISSKTLESTSVFKTVVSGDRVSAEFKGHDSFNFRPFARLMFSANDLPRSADLTDGYFRRLIIVDFPNKFGTNGLKKDPHILDKLSTEEELSGLLNMAVEGLRRLVKNGEFTENQNTIDAIEQYKKDIDPLMTFIDECCFVGEEASADKQALYDEYSSWAYRAGGRPLGKITFYKRIEKSVKLQEYRVTPQSKRRFKGISILDSFL